MIKYFLFIFIPALTLGENVDLAWDPSPDAIGYKLHIGYESKKFTHHFDAGNSVRYLVSGLIPGISYFFTVTAYDKDDVESDFSNEVSFKPAIPPYSITIDRNRTLEVKGFDGGTFAVEYTKDFVEWLQYEKVVFIPKVTLQKSFVDQNPKAFFRAKYLDSYLAHSPGGISLPPTLPSMTKTLTIPTLRGKIRGAFRYRRGRHPEFKKGAELLNSVRRKEK